MPKRKMVTALALIASACLVLSGCGGGGSGSATGSSVDMNSATSQVGGMSYSMESADMESGSKGVMSYSGVVEDSSIVEEAHNNTKLIYTGNMSLETVNFDESLEAVTAMVEDAGGFVQDSDVYNRETWGDTDSYRTASLTVRVPASNFEDLRERLSEGEEFAVVRDSVNSEDVSEQYYDVQTRLESARAEVTRLEELMEEAKSVEDVISVQQALSDATYRLESLQGQLNGLDSRIDYSYMYIDLQEVTALTMTVKAVGYGHKLLESFSNGFTDGIEFIGDFILAVAGNWLVLLIMVIIFILVRILIKRRRRKKQIRQMSEEE